MSSKTRSLWGNHERKGFVWSVEKCLNKPFNNIHNSDDEYAAEVRRVTNGWYSKIQDKKAQKDLGKRFHSNQHYHSALAELIIHEIICLHEYSPIEFHVRTNDSGKNVDFRINRETSEECYIEVTHLEPVKTELDENGDPLLTMTGSDDTAARLKRRLSQKHSKRYGLIDKPYLIAVDSQRDGTELQWFAEALYGQTKMDLTKNNVGGWDSGDRYFDGNGYFFPRLKGKEPVEWDDTYDSGLDGVIAICGTRASQMEFTDIGFFPNPASINWTSKAFPKIPRVKVDENGKMEIQGISLDGLLKK